MPSTRRVLPVWPFYFLAALASAIGAGLIALFLQGRLPTWDELQMVSGSVASFVLYDDLSGRPAAMPLPTSSAHFTLKGVEGEFKYPSRFPRYADVYDRLAFDVDVWVRRDAIGRGEPMLVYQLMQHLPERFPSEPIAVSFEEIVGARARQLGSYLRVGSGLLVAATGLGALGWLVGRRNRRASRATPR